MVAKQSTKCRLSYFCFKVDSSGLKRGENGPTKSHEKDFKAGFRDLIVKLFAHFQPNLTVKCFVLPKFLGRPANIQRGDFLICTSANTLRALTEIKLYLVQNVYAKSVTIILTFNSNFLK
jgi:hypothetical protein